VLHNVNHGRAPFQNPSGSKEKWNAV